VIEDSRTARYPYPAITPAEFEDFVARDLLGAARPAVDELAVTVHEKVAGADGTYDFDATVRYRFAGLAFLVVVEESPRGLVLSADDEDHPGNIATVLLGRQTG
jgi:hypothetical protein